MTTQQYEYQPAAFDGGYFAQFKPHYHITDYQGNVVGVCNYAGRLEQRADYYPYGELHREPTVIGPAASGATVNPFFYTGMERQTTNGLHELAYPARQYAYKVPFFTTTDNLCEKKYYVSPYIMCSSDPINRVDVSGLDDFLINEKGYITQVKTDAPDTFTVYNMETALMADNNGNDIPVDTKTLSLDKKVVKKHINKDVEKKDDDTGKLLQLNIDCLEVEGIEESTQIYEFLADNVFAEFGHLITNTRSNGKKVGHISTSHLPNKEAGGGYNLLQMKKQTDLVIFDHSHPSNNPNPGDSDLNFANEIQTKINPNIRCRIYNPATGYHQFSPKPNK